MSFVAPNWAWGEARGASARAPEHTRQWGCDRRATKPQAKFDATNVVVFMKRGTKHCLAGPAQVFLKLPLAAAAGLARNDQVEAWHKRDELPAGAGLGARVGGDAFGASTAFASQARGQFPAVGDDPRFDLPSHFGSLHVMGWRSGFVHKPFRYDLRVIPSPAPKYAVGDPV